MCNGTLRLFETGYTEDEIRRFCPANRGCLNHDQAKMLIQCNPDNFIQFVAPCTNGCVTVDRTSTQNDYCGRPKMVFEHTLKINVKIWTTKLRWRPLALFVITRTALSRSLGSHGSLKEEEEGFGKVCGHDLARPHLLPPSPIFQTGPVRGFQQTETLCYIAFCCSAETPNLAVLDS